MSRSRIIFPCLLGVALLSAAAQAQINSSVGHGYAPAEHVPPALLAAKTIFLSNAGADSGLFPHPFSGDPNRGYATFYAAIQASGMHQLVDNPAAADLVLELHIAGIGGDTACDIQHRDVPYRAFIDSH